MSAHIHPQQGGMRIKVISVMSDRVTALSSSLKIFQKKINTGPAGQPAMYLEVLSRELIQHSDSPISAASKAL